MTGALLGTVILRFIPDIALCVQCGASQRHMLCNSVTVGLLLYTYRFLQFLSGVQALQSLPVQKAKDVLEDQYGDKELQDHASSILAAYSLHESMGFFA